jgi:hypothetical protein
LLPAWECCHGYLCNFGHDSRDLHRQCRHSFSRSGFLSLGSLATKGIRQHQRYGCRYREPRNYDYRDPDNWSFYGYLRFDKRKFCDFGDPSVTYHKWLLCYCDTFLRILHG